MSRSLSRRLVPDALWKLAAPLIPAFPPRPQGGGTPPLDDREVFAAIVFVLTSGSPWRRLPPSFAVSPATAHRRFLAWTRAGLWGSLRAVVQRESALDVGDREWAAAILDAAESSR
ncbi:transposase [Streptomyces sp. NPDC057798]|uniref:transposase n=1 Tax=Streptomyces sp. NPDC057798 TaxID=3346252 RepID=UPI0036C7862E